MANYVAFKYPTRFLVTSIHTFTPVLLNGNSSSVVDSGKSTVKGGFD